MSTDRPRRARGLRSSRRPRQVVAPTGELVAVRGRLARVSIATSIGAGAWVGLAIGMLIGVLLGAFVVWAAGAILDWQREIAFTVGVTRQLLPFGSQAALLRGLSDSWAIAIPAAGLVCGLIGAAFGGLTGGLLAAAYNRSPRHASVVVELPIEDRIVAAEPTSADRGAPEHPASALPAHAAPSPAGRRPEEPARPSTSGPG